MILATYNAVSRSSSHRDLVNIDYLRESTIRPALRDLSKQATMALGQLIKR
jgi:hypothetical protein